MSHPGGMPAASSRELARTLQRVGMLRGITAFAVGAYVISRAPISAIDIARASAAYWFVDGLVSLWAATFADVLAPRRMVLLLRGAVATAAGLIILGLPLDVVFGPWRPGHALLLTLVVALMLTVIGFQIVVGALDVIVGVEIRRRLPEEWSFALGAAFAGALAVMAAATFAVPAPLLGRALSAAAILTGFGLLVGAAKLDGSRTASSLPLYPRKR